MVTRLEKLDQSEFLVDEICTLQDYLIFVVKTVPKKGNRKILLSAGIHGDEPAGVEAIVAAMESGLLKKWSDRFNFTVLPCLNPSGYDLGSRENENGVDINRTFDKNDVTESSAVKKFLEGKKFDLFLEFHEDWEYDGYYLYEVADSGRKVGKKIISKLEKEKFSIYNGIADGRQTKDGIVQVGNSPPPEASKVMPLYIYNQKIAPHIITSETPSKMNIESRIRMHLIVLDVALGSL